MKTTAILLAVCALLLCACGGGDDGQDEKRVAIPRPPDCAASVTAGACI